MSRWSSALLHGGLSVVFVAAALASAPRPASARVLICGDMGCFMGGGSCADWRMPGGWVCGDVVGSITNTSRPHLVRDASGGASFVNDGKATPIMPDAVESTLKRLMERQRGDARGRLSQDAYRSAFEEALRSADRRVSDQRLQSISRELNLPIERVDRPSERARGATTASPGSATNARAVIPGGSGPVARELGSILDRYRFSQETAGLMVQVLLEQGGGPYLDYYEGGGWCWNDDGTFYGSVPCPKKVAVTDATAGSGARRAPQGSNRTVRLSSVATREFDAFMGRTTMSRETAEALMPVLLAQLGGRFPGYKEGGGWCWNDDGTFHGSVPCPKK